MPRGRGCGGRGCPSSTPIRSQPPDLNEYWGEPPPSPIPASGEVGAPPCVSQTSRVLDDSGNYGMFGPPPSTHGARPRALNDSGNYGMFGPPPSTHGARPRAMDSMEGYGQFGPPPSYASPRPRRLSFNIRIPMSKSSVNISLDMSSLMSEMSGFPDLSTSSARSGGYSDISGIQELPSSHSTYETTPQPGPSRRPVTAGPSGAGARRRLQFNSSDMDPSFDLSDDAACAPCQPAPGSPQRRMLALGAEEQEDLLGDLSSFGPEIQGPIHKRARG